ncbi:MAG TPA: nucleotidyltransferase domain-containing protein [Salinimicrobium sp.]|nr:nucleotidyltransferase domain-containing protein [Salinimicrobium sp.]
MRGQKAIRFGSLVSGDFMQNSDLDFLVEFERPGYSGAFNQFMGFKERLEQIFKRPVDLLQAKKFRNTIFQQEVEKTKVLFYAS